MNGLCRQMQDKIADYVIGALSKEETDAVNQHTAQCPQCRAYMEAMQRQGGTLSQWAEEVQSRMPSQEDKVIAALEDVRPQRAQSVWRIVAHSNLARLTAAALLILGIGFLAGRLSAPSVGDIQQLRAQFQESLTDCEQRIIEQTNQDMDAALSAVQNQLRLDLKEFGIQTLAAVKTVTDQRSAELIQLIEQARLRDRWHIEAALEYIQAGRLQDNARFGMGLQALAAKTSELPDTEQRQAN